MSLESHAWHEKREERSRAKECQGIGIGYGFAAGRRPTLTTTARHRAPPNAQPATPSWRRPDEGMYMSENKSTKIEVRLSESLKAQWQAEADARGVSLSVLVRERMAHGALTAPPTDSGPSTEELRGLLTEINEAPKIDLNAPELESLRGWLRFTESGMRLSESGDLIEYNVIDDELLLQLAEWGRFAKAHDITLLELIEDVAADVNADLLQLAP